MAPADHGEPLPELRGLELPAELALEHDDVSAAERAPPGRRGGGGGGVAFGEEVVGGAADFGEVVDVWVFREGVAEGGEGCAAGDGDGGVGGEEVPGGGAAAVRG